MARFAAYALLSVLAVAAVVYHAQATRVQFYPTVVYLTTSKLSITLLANLTLVIAYALARVLMLLYFGQISVAEHEVRSTAAARQLPRTHVGSTPARRASRIRCRTPSSRRCSR